jgi:hypothetical protein
MVKTLAKPMLHYRLLNCRASGLLEQSHAPESRVGRFFNGASLAATAVMRDVMSLNPMFDASTNCLI